VIESHFNNGVAENIIGRLSDKELSDLAQMYRARSATSNTRLLSIFAAKLSDQSLLRVASAFGVNAVKQAVIQHATPEVKSAFLAEAAFVMPLANPKMMRLPPPSPPSAGWANTIQDIYLDYRTSSLGMGVAESLSATTIYVSTAMYGSWQFGTAIGYGVSSLITNYDPSLNDAIGGTVAGMMLQTQNSMTYLQQGQLQSSFDSLFGYPITTSGNISGPYDLTSPMNFYYQTYGMPGSGGGGGGGCGPSLF
jgi:hypothetical protein